MRKPGRAQAAGPGAKWLKLSWASAPSMTDSTWAASSTVRAKIETQSRLRQAGSTPRVLTRPGVGFRPTSWLKPAGTRPDPAVSVPREKATPPPATTTAEPELEPPLMCSGLNTLAGWP